MMSCESQTLLVSPVPPEAHPQKKTILTVKDLAVQIGHNDQRFFALKDVSFELHRQETLGLVGESGSGKTMTALTLLDLLPAGAEQVRGEIWFANERVSKDHKPTFGQLRGKHIAIIFQEPMAALNPVFRIGKQMSEVIRTHLKLSSQEARKRIMQLLQYVGLHDAERIYRAYPHQLSGGMGQRVMIAMALSCNPDILIADEPTTSLDVMTQARIMSLIKSLQERFEFALLLISHDLGVVASTCDAMMVLQDGKIVERGTTQEVLSRPQKAYTRKLVESIFGLANVAGDHHA